jgi:hypothetical protein
MTMAQRMQRAGARPAKKTGVQRKSVARAKGAAPRNPRRVEAKGGASAPVVVQPAAPEAPAPGNAAWTPAEGEVGVRVRMYRVGFGDFFLVTLLDGQGKPLHIIIDCGVFKGTSQTGDINSIESAVANMAQITEGEVALVIMTHRHADHIAGFARCADTFKKLKVQAVWMPVWESEYEPAALKFQAQLTRTAMGLRQHFTSLGAQASEEQDTARKYMENATGELAATGGAAAGSNAAALDLLKRGFGVTPAYYKCADTAALPKVLADAGLACQILGPPPITDTDLMNLMDLQKNVGQYLAPDEDSEAGICEPFADEWQVEPNPPASNRPAESYAPESFREWVQNPRKWWQTINATEASLARTQMQLALAQSQPIAALTAAKQLNSFLNNQSLVVLFTFKGKKLLFVGDAQAGNWEHWLFGTDTPDKTAGQSITADALKILAGVDFYKVGHHGSGNATPIIAAQSMGVQGHRFACMCSTEAGVYGTENPDDPTKGTEVPRIPLLAKLGTEGALVRSDQIPINGNNGTVKAKVPAPLPSPVRGTRYEQGAIWVDCFL